MNGKTGAERPEKAEVKEHLEIPLDFMENICYTREALIKSTYTDLRQEFLPARKKSAGILVSHQP